MDDKSFLELKNRSLFARLKKLFSDEVIVRNIGGKKLKVADIHSIEYATDRNSLRDRFNRLRTSTTDNYSRDFNLAFQRNRTEIFRDYDTMDMDPILHSALDVYADECLSEDTIISLPGDLDYTIKELFDLHKKNFEVYSVDKYGKVVTQVCDHVAYNGQKEMYQITFDDETVIKCTKNHLWRTHYGDFEYTEALHVGDFLTAYKNNKNYSIRIIDIRKLEGLYDSYDLVNVGTSHIYMVKSIKGLNIVCHNCTTLSEMGELIKIYSSNDDIHDALENLFNDILNVRYNLWSWVRSLCKYGDFYLRLFISPDYGVYAVKPYSAYNVTRIENSDLSNRNYVKYQVTIPEGNRMEELENYEMIHFRLISDSNFMPNGLSMLEGGRRAWKQLCVKSTTQIWTDKGYKMIKDLNIGDNIYSFNPETLLTEKTRVAKIERTSLSTKTVTIKTRNRELVVTPDHKLLVKTYKGDFVYKEAQEILTNNKDGETKSDKLVFPTVQGGKKTYTIYLDPEDYCVKLNNLGREVINKLRKTKNDFYITNNGRDLRKDKNGNVIVKYYKFFSEKYNKNESISYNEFKEIKDEYNLTFNHVDLYYRRKTKGTHAKYHCSHVKSIVDPDTLSFTVDVEFCRAFGFMLGDGWLNPTGIGFAAGIHEECNQRYLRILSKYNSGRYYYQARHLEKYPNTPGNYNFGNVELRYLFEKLGFIHGFKNKRIPNWIWDMDIECRRNMVLGLFDADGSWKYGTLGLSNYELITQLKTLANQCGIMTSVVRGANKVEGIGRNGLFNSLSWKLQLNFKQQYDIFYQKVVSITENENEDEVWNLTTESPLHNYVMEGIVSKNCLLEDSMLVQKIMRAPEKRVFKIDVGNTPPNEIENLMNRIMNQMQKVPYMDQNGEYNLRYNMQNMIQDFFLPARGKDSGTSIETLPGLEWDGINAVEYIRNKMMAALKIPKPFLGYDESQGDKATLAQMDVRFCRTIQRIQKFVLSGLIEIAIVHLYSLGYRDEDLLDFELELTNPSTIFEKEKIEIFKNKADLCQTMQEQKLFSKKWMYENIFGLSDQEIIELQKQLVDDSKANYRFSQIENEGSDPVLRFLKTQTPGPKTKKSDDLSDITGSSGSDIDTDLDLDTDEISPDEEELTDKEDETSNLKESDKWKSPFNAHKNHNKMVKKKWDSKRDQTGRKDASKYRFGEDPLGDLENKRAVKLKTAKIKAYEDSLYNRIYKEDNREFLSENDEKSYMDLELDDKNELI